MVRSCPLRENEVARSKTVISINGILFNLHNIPADDKNYNKREVKFKKVK